MDKVSIYCSAIRPHYWHKFKIFEDNKVDFEIIFAGDVKPDFKLPSYMKHIYTEVKPAQCFFLAGQQSQGNYIMNVADDHLYSPGYLDCMIENIKKNDESSTILSPRFLKHGHGFFGGDEGLVLPVCSFSSRELWDKYPIDKNFVALFWDVDVAMSNYEDGGKVVICEGATTTDDLPDKSNTSTTFKRFGDIQLFYSLWTDQIKKIPKRRTKGYRHYKRNVSEYLKVVKERKQAREPLVNSDDILTKSQGKKDRWK